MAIGKVAKLFPENHSIQTLYLINVIEVYREVSQWKHKHILCCHLAALFCLLWRKLFQIYLMWVCRYCSVILAQLTSDRQNIYLWWASDGINLLSLIYSIVTPSTTSGIVIRLDQNNIKFGGSKTLDLNKLWCPKLKFRRSMRSDSFVRPDLSLKTLFMLK